MDAGLRRWESQNSTARRSTQDKSLSAGQTLGGAIVVAASCSSVRAGPRCAKCAAECGVVGRKRAASFATAPQPDSRRVNKLRSGVACDRRRDQQMHGAVGVLNHARAVVPVKVAILTLCHPARHRLLLWLYVLFLVAKQIPRWTPVAPEDSDVGPTFPRTVPSACRPALLGWATLLTSTARHGCGRPLFLPRDTTTTRMWSQAGSQMA